MPNLQLRVEFLAKHMLATAIELCNRQNTGWTQKAEPDELLEITYPTSDVQRALDAISAARSGKPIVLLGQRGSGKSHIMALLHHGFNSPDSVESWAHQWSSRTESSKLAELSLQRGFTPISETLSNQEYPCLWDVIFDRHPKGGYYRGKFDSSGTSIPSKSLLQDMFQEQRTALIFDEMQTWFDGLHDEPGEHGPKRRQWAFNFIQILSELAKERPDLMSLVVSVRNSTTEAFRQIHRDGPVLVDFKGETAREDRKRLVLHRLFQNRSNISDTEIEQLCSSYANESVRLLHSDKNAADQAKVRLEVVKCWPFAPELLNLLEDHILMSSAAQDNRDLIRILAEVYRVRGNEVPIITPADFCVDDDECGVTSLLDAFATSADQERLREKAIRNLQEVRDANANTPHVRGVISSLWMRSLSASQDVGGTRNEVQLDITRESAIDDNAFTVELATIVENSVNIHEVGTQQKRFCFKLPDNPVAKLKAWARNDKTFEPDAATAPGLLPVGRDQEYLRDVLVYVLKSPDSISEQPSIPVVLDPNWEKAPWANLPASDQPPAWTERGNPVLIVLPEAPKDSSTVLGPWLVENVPVNRNMLRFLLPKVDEQNIYLDRDLLITARCALLAREWKVSDPQYSKLHQNYEGDLKTELKKRFDRYSMLAVWDYETPTNCTFHEEKLTGAGGGDAPTAIETHIRKHVFAVEDFEPVVLAAASRGDTMRQLFALLQAEPLPGQTAIPYLGELPIYEEVLQIAADDKIAVNVGGRWHHKEADETPEAALMRLRQRAWPPGPELHAIQLGELSQVGGPGLAATPPSTSAGEPGSTGVVVGPAQPVGGGGVSTPPPVPGLPPLTAPGDPIGAVRQPVIRKSLGSKIGVNLLGDLEKWALPDKQTVTQATLTFNGATVKELRDLVTRMPPKLSAELQITLPPEEEGVE